MEHGQSTHARGRRTGGRSARVRAAVLQAATDVLAECGLDAFTVGEVARRSGVHETSIYRRWGTKEQLALDAVLSRTETVIPVPDTGTLRGDLLALQHAIGAFVNTPLGKLLLQLAIRHDLPEYDSARQQFWAHRAAVASAVLDRAQARGELRPGLDHRLVFQTLIGPMHVRLLLTREPVDAAFLDAVVDLLLAGLTARSSTPDNTGTSPNVTRL